MASKKWSKYAGLCSAHGFPYVPTDSEETLERILVLNGVQLPETKEEAPEKAVKAEKKEVKKIEKKIEHKEPKLSEIDKERIAQLRERYEDLYGQPVSNRYKFDEEWITKKIALHD
jgi:anti-sigma28 factor (negative regulator of flagellin synthesis)